MYSLFESVNNFSSRHIGPNKKELKEMLATIGVESLQSLIGETVPDSIRLKNELDIPDAVTEYEFLNELKKIASKNKIYKTYIGMGYYDTITPSVIQRNILENPGWYTSYTPYQAEIAQGRLESLLNFQTMITDLTGMEFANASLLDEGTAAAEAMAMFHRLRDRNSTANKLIISDQCFPQTIDVLKTRANPLGIEIEVVNIDKINLDDTYFGAILQYPCEDGQIKDYSKFIEEAHKNKILVAVATDLLSLVLLTPPKELGADVAFGSAQRFGVPLGYGGPHAAFFATRDEFKRQISGRIIGVSVDVHGNKAYRMALQTREQHIKRDKANSNICTAQALLANMSAMYAVYHGSEGLKEIALNVHLSTQILDNELTLLGYEQINTYYFDTLKICLNSTQIEKLKDISLENKINFRYIDDKYVGISLDETTSVEDLNNIVSVFSQVKSLDSEKINTKKYQKHDLKLPEKLKRKGDILTHKVFNTYQSETKMMRYIKSLENKDISLTNSMIPLGSCTMKLNAASEMYPISWAEFSKLHPFAPLDQAQGYLEIFSELEKYLSSITGFEGVSLQPNSGAQGEFAGLMVIREYFLDKKQGHRNIALIPSSAHGTNPASAVMAGMEVVVTKCDDFGNIDMEDLKEKVNQYKDNLSCLMVTYPSTHGVFEESIKEICQLIHQNGGLVYMDGANMNAQVGLTSPAEIGADVCHLNLHKTFSIPHGGGGPGMGPICVTKALIDYLPGHALIKTGGEKSIHAVSSAPWGSASILLISYAYIKMLGRDGIKSATEFAILNANYIKSRLEKYYQPLYTGKNNRVAHELIIDTRVFKNTSKVEVEDIAKRLIDYGFHAPTMSWPVIGTMMIEPTESEDKDELDRFCDAMISIYNEIKEIESGVSDMNDNVLKNAPHT
ncbi:MAG: aminomethyl-transferring glycine dehydrogenase, partial [Candidatus Sericytochromatia bacterium]|nr:aminomethyl-transferring glycine dehydrogenase [Candidatus Sericytochromatia bacterium]